MLGVFRQVIARDHAAHQPEPGASVARIPSTRREAYIAGLAALSVVAHLVLRYGIGASTRTYDAPLMVAVAVGGIPLIIELARRLVARDLGADLLAGASIITAVVMREYLVGAIVVLMLSGGTALEQYATRRASSVLNALAKRMPEEMAQKLSRQLLAAEDRIVEL